MHWATPRAWVVTVRSWLRASLPDAGPGKAAAAVGGRVVAGRGSGGPAAGREVGDRTAATVHAAAGRAEVPPRPGRCSAGHGAGLPAAMRLATGPPGPGLWCGISGSPRCPVASKTRAGAASASCTMRTDQPGPAPSSSSYDDSPHTGGSRKVTTGRPSAPLALLARVLHAQLRHGRDVAERKLGGIVVGNGRGRAIRVSRRHEALEEGD